MLEKNKITTYLFYAIGEIILVVVGILIAVNIDDWNESNKNRKLEVKYLKSIKQDLQSDLVNLERLIDFRQRKIKASNVIMSQIRNESNVDLFELNRSIRVLLREGHFTPNNTTFSELSSSGNLSLISNDTIKVLLHELQKIYSANEGSIEHEIFDYREYISKPMLQNVSVDIIKAVDKSEKSIDEVGLTREDFHALLTNKGYRNGVTIIGEMSEAFVLGYQKIQELSNEIIEIINQEIEKE